MPGPAPPDRPPRAHHAIAVAAGLLVLAAGCSAGSDRTGTPGPSTSPQPGGPALAGTAPPSRPPPSPIPAPESDSPQTVATRWLVAYHSARWTDPTPAAWIDRVRPYVTDTLHASNDTLRNGGGGTDWADFVRGHCTSSVTDTHAVIPPESPGTDTTANVQVTGTIDTTCTAGSPARATEQVSATLVVVTTATGWRVDHRLF